MCTFKFEKFYACLHCYPHRDEPFTRCPQAPVPDKNRLSKIKGFLRVSVKRKKNQVVEPLNAANLETEGDANRTSTPQDGETGDPDPDTQGGCGEKVYETYWIEGMCQGCWAELVRKLRFEEKMQEKGWVWYPVSRSWRMEGERERERNGGLGDCGVS